MTAQTQRRTRIAAALVGLGVVGCFAFCIYHEHIDNRVGESPGRPTTCLGLASTQVGFSKQEWLQADPVRKRELARQWVTEHRFLGLNKPQVFDALGKPDGDVHNIFYYGLGEIDHSLDDLEIVFDGHGKAAQIAYSAAD